MISSAEPVTLIPLSREGSFLDTIISARNTVAEVYAQVIADLVEAGKVDVQFIEIMGCPGGCVNGGGQPTQPATVHNFVDLKAIRGQALYEADRNLPVRKSHENEAVKAVYAEYFEKPGSHVAHEVLHTHYVKRRKYSKQFRKYT